MSLNFCFIGAGNLATHLAEAFYSKGFKILQVYSRTVESASKLAKVVNAEYTSQISDLTRNADIYIIALKDSVINEVLSGFDFQNKLLVHCAGSLPLKSLEKFSDNIGVIYPLQTFSKNRKIVFNSVPVFIEANSRENEHLLFELVNNISENVSFLNSEKRLRLHIAAVFSCNFVNYFYHVASEILKEKKIGFEVLRPLILETALKVQEMMPDDAQTGPAVRFDTNIINRHLEELTGNQDYRDLYEQISKRIFSLQNK